ncbi:hypothetical protein RR46_02832 [Papilio xuthus]|uniref:Uncharacterized protein n=1 Tax=Papilio xuthus TaxID=66420 RepID=A0A194QD50_PAPXU|nr:hypothetical protein RR46_02832 [Papilio xuthus]
MFLDRAKDRARPCLWVSLTPFVRHWQPAQYSPLDGARRRRSLPPQPPPDPPPHRPQATVPSAPQPLRISFTAHNRLRGDLRLSKSNVSQTNPFVRGMGRKGGGQQTSPPPLA